MILQEPASDAVSVEVKGTESAQLGMILFEGDKLLEEGDKFAFDLDGLIEDAWDTGTVVIALPNIPTDELNALKDELRRNAAGDSLDLDAIVYDSTEDGNAEVDRWTLGLEDGKQLFVHIYPKESFSGAGITENVFNEKIVVKHSSEPFSPSETVQMSGEEPNEDDERVLTADERRRELKQVTEESHDEDEEGGDPRDPHGKD